MSEADESKLIKHGDKSILTITTISVSSCVFKNSKYFCQTKMVLGDLLYGSLAFL